MDSARAPAPRRPHAPVARVRTPLLDGHFGARWLQGVATGPPPGHGDRPRGRARTVLFPIGPLLIAQLFPLEPL